MTIAELYLPEFDQEIANTRRMLERVPDDKFDFAPHPRSMTLGRLASHLAEMPRWLTVAVTTEMLEPGPDMKGFNAETRQQLLEEFDSRARDARELLATATDDHLAGTWTFKYQGHVIFALPRRTVIRSMVLSHMIHHRAQLGVYLRLLDIPIPGPYGPSADEMPAIAVS
jgi:uncharacterized damage-inducible protein DinB